MWHRINEKMAQYLMELLETEKNYDEITVAKVQYAVLVLLDESEKFILLSLMYGFFYDVGKFALAFTALVSLRIFIGGSHRKTKLGCLLSSMVNFMLILGFAELFTMPVLGTGGLAGLLALEIMLWAPLASPQQLHCTEQRKQKMRKRALITLVAEGTLLLLLPAELGNIISWAWAYQAAEVLLVVLFRCGKDTAKIR